MTAYTLSQEAYRYIRQRIAGGFLPAGSQVSELSLAKEIGISRTPVREAIRRLALEGLVEQVPRYGTIVRTPDRQELAELYEVREALESYAAAEAARRITPDDLQVLAALVRRMRAVGYQLRRSGSAALDGTGLKRFLAADMGFHMVLIRAGGNRRMMKIVADTQVLTRIFGFRRQTHDLAIVARTCRLHGRIVRAVRQRDRGAARTWMARHIRLSKRQTLEAFDQTQTDAGGVVPLALPDDVQEELNRLEIELNRETT